MKWNEIAKLREQFLTSSEVELSRKVKGFESELYIDLVELFEELEVDKDGRLRYTSKNILTVQKINRAFEKKTAELRPSLLKRLVVAGLTGWLIGKVYNLLGLHTRYVRALGVKRKPETIEEEALRLVFQQLGWDKKKGVVRGSWLDSLIQAEAVKARVMSKLYFAMSTGMDLREFRRNFRAEFISSKDGLGLFAKHYQMHTGHFFASLDRQAAVLYAKKAGLTKAIYSGTRIEGTRPFCWERTNHIYSLEEIESWNGLPDWAGRIKGANVLTVAGGYQCRHTYNFITDSLAESLIKRGRKFNEYTPKPKKDV